MVCLLCIYSTLSIVQLANTKSSLCDIYIREGKALQLAKRKEYYPYEFL
jgi:hypothetical protein